MEEMMNYIKEAIIELDVFTEERGDGAIIVVPNKLRHRKTNKNVFTFWPSQSSMGLIILGRGYMPERRQIHSVAEMKELRIAELIVSKYNEMVG